MLLHSFVVYWRNSSLMLWTSPVGANPRKAAAASQAIKSSTTRNLGQVSTANIEKRGLLLATILAHNNMKSGIYKDGNHHSRLRGELLSHYTWWQDDQARLCFFFSNLACGIRQCECSSVLVWGMVSHYYPTFGETKEVSDGNIAFMQPYASTNHITLRCRITSKCFSNMTRIHLPINCLMGRIWEWASRRIQEGSGNYIYGNIYGRCRRLTSNDPQRRIMVSHFAGDTVCGSALLINFHLAVTSSCSPQRHDTQSVDYLQCPKDYIVWASRFS